MRLQPESQRIGRIRGIGAGGPLGRVVRAIAVGILRGSIEPQRFGKIWSIQAAEPDSMRVNETEDAGLKSLKPRPDAIRTASRFTS